MILGQFFIGATLASHLMVVNERTQNQTDFVRGSSRCTNCGFLLTLWDLIPIVSFITLGGKCRYCKSNIPANLFIAELVGGLLFASLNLSDPYSLNYNLSLGLFFFFGALAALEDQREMEFCLLYLVPSFVFSLLFHFQNILANIMPLVLVLSLLLIVLVLTNKFGLGDLLFLLIIFFTFGLAQTNRILLLGCILFLAKNFGLRNSKTPAPFLPPLYLASILVFLLSTAH